MKNKQSFSIQKVYAINKGKAVARKLQESLGVDILQDRRELMTYGEIVAKNDLVRKSGLSKKCMSPLIHHILYGYDGENPLSPIIGKDEARCIYSKIRRRMYASTLGSQTKEERIEASSKSGSVCYKKGVGIFGRDSEVISADAKKGGRGSTLKRGQIPWETGEKLLVYLLYKSGVYGCQEIVPIVNNLWGNNRTASSIGCQGTRFKKIYIGLENIFN